jgi:hypothetical protein
MWIRCTETNANSTFNEPILVNSDHVIKIARHKSQQFTSIYLSRYASENLVSVRETLDEIGAQLKYR